MIIIKEIKKEYNIFTDETEKCISYYNLILKSGKKD